MTVPNLRALLDDATADLPAEVQKPPLAAIKGRVRRARRTRLTVLAASVVALTTAALAPALWLRAAPPPPPPVAGPAGIAWDFAQVEGATMTIYTGAFASCTVLDGAAAQLVRADGAVTVTLTGTPRRADDCSTTGIPAVRITLDRPLGTEALRDGATGQERPLYDRADLPAIETERGWVGFSWGAARHNRAAPVFEARYFELNKAPLEVQGKGLVSTSAVQPGEPMRFGSAEGRLLEVEGGYRFVWEGTRVSGAGNRVQYEIGVMPRRLSRAELVSMLNRLTWP